MAFIPLEPSVVIVTAYSGLPGHWTAASAPTPSSSGPNGNPIFLTRFRISRKGSPPDAHGSKNCCQPSCLNSPGFIGCGYPQTFPGNNLIIALWVSAPNKLLFSRPTFMSVHGQFSSRGIWHECAGAPGMPHCAAGWQARVEEEGRGSRPQAGCSIIQNVAVGGNAHRRQVSF